MIGSTIDPRNGPRSLARVSSRGQVRELNLQGPRPGPIERLQLRQGSIWACNFSQHLETGPPGLQPRRPSCRSKGEKAGLCIYPCRRISYYEVIKKGSGEGRYRCHPGTVSQAFLQLLTDICSPSSAGLQPALARRLSSSSLLPMFVLCRPGVSIAAPAVLCCIWGLSSSICLQLKDSTRSGSCLR